MGSIRARAPCSQAAGDTEKEEELDRVTVSVSVGYVEIEGRRELVGRGTERMHGVRLADVVEL